MHNNNIHKNKYDFDQLIKNCEELTPFVFENSYNTKTIDFSNPEAVKLLNKALLSHHYELDYWEFPDENLCPPIPSRADYIHHLTDLLRRSSLGSDCKILDIGAGASCIYPLLGYAINNWSFVGTDIDARSLKIAQLIVDENKLSNHIELRLQKNSDNILKGIVTLNDKFEASICNPPFFRTEAEALEATKQKLKGLGNQNDKVVRNFSGTSKELTYKGGEKAFLHTYLYESTFYKTQFYWFTSLVSNVNHLKSMQTSLKKLGATMIEIIEMIQGNKISRIIAWSFLSKAEQKEWKT